MQILILVILLLAIVVKRIIQNTFNWEDMLDVSILTSFLLAFLSGHIAKIITHFVNSKCEDAAKLKEDYDTLVKLYSRENLVSFGGAKFPVIMLAFRGKKEGAFELEFDRFVEHYQLPGLVRENADWLMKAHGHSTVYNNMTIRLDDLVVNGNRVRLCYSGTKYYYSLVTNRAMDYLLKNGRTIREIYEPGPFISLLPESRLSNHLGFNGFVETSDGAIIFVLRDEKLSIGKKTLGDSIGASYKVKYGLDADHRMTEETVRRVIREEIWDELKIGISEDVELEKSIFAFYRDLVEGGKPQFLFYYKLPNLTKQKFEENFHNRKSKSDKKRAVTDGDKFVFMELDDLKRCQIFPGKIVLVNETEYSIMPSASAAIVMLLKYLDA